ncbi:MAG TPA: hypothetical protein PKW33_16935 [Anaerolineaceae bacterium]|nr:hypothetical protein [Anaerolineaceae bacterium]HPN53285.1 hypothetical protein [Anaerolineaceae bacterium]
MVGSISGMRPMMPMNEARSLTTDQKNKLQEILSKVDPESITANDAQELFSALDEAGIRGPEVRDAIKAAGFDAEQLWSLGHDGQKPPQGPPPGGGPGGPGGGMNVNMNNLQTLKEILSQYDLSNLSEDDSSQLMQLLNKAGLFTPGSMIDTGA